MYSIMEQFRWGTLSPLFPRKGNPVSDKTNNRILLSVIACVMIVCCISVLGGCNTMAGLGKDIQSAAQGIQDRMSQPEDSYSTASRR